MADSDNNHRYTTRTTIITQEQRMQQPVFIGGVVDTPELDVGYLKTLSGLVKCIAIALDFICFICLLVGGPGYYTATGGATFVAVVGMVVSITLLFLYLFRIVDVLRQIPWIICEMIFCFMWSVFYFTCACVLAVAAAQFHGATGFGAASFFAFGAMCTYGFDCYLKFLAWRNNEVATGGSGGVVGGGGGGGGAMDFYGDSTNVEAGLHKRIAINEQSPSSS